MANMPKMTGMLKVMARSECNCVPQIVPYMMDSMYEQDPILKVDLDQATFTKEIQRKQILNMNKTKKDFLSFNLVYRKNST